MQQKTAGIVLHTLKYSDSSSIITIYTSHFGRISYMVYGANKKKSKIRAGFFQPLSIVDLDVVHHPSKELQQIKDIRIKYAFSSLPYHPVKNAIGLFLAEILFRTLTEKESDEKLYYFLENAIQILDILNEGIANFHLIFLTKMTKYLGFEPTSNVEHSRFFDMEHGIFCNEQPQHSNIIEMPTTENFRKILQGSFNSINSIEFSRQERNALLGKIMNYYQLHIPETKAIQSLSVLHSLFDD